MADSVRDLSSEDELSLDMDGETLSTGGDLSSDDEIKLRYSTWERHQDLRLYELPEVTVRELEEGPDSRRVR